MKQQTLPTFNPDRAVFISNMRLRQLTMNERTPASGYQRAILNDASGCHMGMCPERTARDRKISGADLLIRCAGCGTLRNDWNTLHPNYQPWDTICPDCK